MSFCFFTLLKTWLKKLCRRTINMIDCLTPGLIPGATSHSRKVCFRLHKWKVLVYWRDSLERGLVPVVLGSAQYSPELVIPGSFINAADFDSVKDLADYLKYLDKNETAYNQYFQWKTKYKVVKYEFWLCQLCKALHDPTKPPKIYHKMSEYWGRYGGSCQLNEDRVWNIINKGWKTARELGALVTWSPKTESQANSRRNSRTDGRTNRRSEFKCTFGIF